MSGRQTSADRAADARIKSGHDGICVPVIAGLDPAISHPRRLSPGLVTRLGWAAILVLLLACTSAWAQPVHIVAAENFYGDVARQIAGPKAKVVSILSNPDADPHLFETSPGGARELAGARIVVYNGADYDPWMPKLLGGTRSADRLTIVVADLLHKRSGDNPHLWYDPAAMPAVAQALSAALATADPARKSEYEERLQRFLASLQPLQAKLAGLRQRYAGAQVTATEPVFSLMAAALGLDMRNERFQRAVMNNTEPSASDIAVFEADLRQRAVRLLIYNSQASDPAARRLLRIARSSGVPIVGVTETEPDGKTYQAWMLDVLNEIEKALSGRAS